MIVLEDLLTLNDAEKNFYELYLKYPDLYENSAKTLKEWSEDEKLFSEYKKITKKYFGNFNFFRENFGEDIFKVDENVIVFMHQRYFPYFAHSHDFFEITYVLRGKYHPMINDRLLELNKGDLCILTPKVWHCPLIHTKEDIICDILVKSSTFDKIFFDILKNNSTLANFFSRSLQIPSGGSYLKFSTKADKEVEYILLSMLSEYQKQDSYYSCIITKFMSILFVFLIRNHSGTLNTAFSGHLNFSKKITSIIQYMKENIKSVTFSELAKKFSYSERQLARLLIKYTGKNFSSILQELRIQKASKLLREQNLSVREIILECGCKNQNYFYKIFKKYFGKTLAQYREDTAKEKLFENI